jgi:hypothetical protein
VYFDAVALAPAGILLVAAVGDMLLGVVRILLVVVVFPEEVSDQEMALIDSDNYRPSRRAEKGE